MPLPYRGGCVPRKSYDLAGRSLRRRPSRSHCDARRVRAGAPARCCRPAGGLTLPAPWLEAELEDAVAVMGEDFHPYGLERNRAQIDAFAGEAFRLGLTSRRVTTDEYFADYLQGG